MVDKLGGQTLISSSDLDRDLCGSGRLVVAAIWQTGDRVQQAHVDGVLDGADDDDRGKVEAKEGLRSAGVGEGSTL